MAKAAAKPAAKPSEEDIAEAHPKKKGKKKLFIIIALVVMLLAGGAVAVMLLMTPAPVQKHGDEANAETQKAEEDMRRVDSKNPPTFIDLGTFTANLVREEGDRYLQVTIQLKLAKPEMVEQIKLNAPEIQHRVNMLLQSKRPSELYSYEGKELLADQIRGQVEYVLGLRKTPPPITSGADVAPVQATGRKSDISEVLFTSFIIQ